MNKLKAVDFNSGDMNFIISSIAGEAYLSNKSYQTINNVIGAIEGSKLEFYRRVAGNHEDLKVIQNKDIEPYDKAAKYVDAEFGKILPTVEKK